MCADATAPPLVKAFLPGIQGAYHSGVILLSFSGDIYFGKTMAIFAWNDSLSVGLASVDYQHRRLVEMVNQLDEAVSTGSDENTLRAILRGLYDYTYYHFTTEEEIMRAAGPTLAQHYVLHKTQHDDFTRKIRPLADNAPLDSTNLNAAVLDYLVTWLVEHIMGSDKDMGRLVLERSRPGDTPPDLPAANEPSPAAPDDVQRNLLGALHESELRFRSLADSVPLLIWIGDDTGRRVFLNSAWQRLTGLTPQELANDRWQECIHPDDRADYLAALKVAGRDHAAFNHEFRVRREDGTYRWFLESTVLRPARGRHFAGLVGSGLDITERKAAEQVLLDSRAQLETEVAVRTAQLTEANARLQREKEEQLQLNRKLSDTQAQLLQSEKMASVGQLAAGVAHEINNPIGFVMSNIHTLRDYVESLLQVIDAYDQLGRDTDEITGLKQKVDYAFLRDDIGKLLLESEDGVERVKHIVQDLKDFSHVDQAEWKPADLNSGLESTLNIVHNELKYKAVVVRDLQPLPLIECLPQQLNQVFVNLLVNAAHAIDQQGTITVRTQAVADGVSVEISDTGHGIAPEHLGRIFDPFFTTKPVGHGTGLGLSIAYGIVTKHGGRIEVTSAVGKGSTFRIVLPLHPLRPEAREAAAGIPA